MKLILPIILSILSSGCKKSNELIEPSGFPESIGDIIARDTALSIFYNACKLNSLDTLLFSKVYYTVLVPNNFAFRVVGINEKNISKNEVLKKQLMYLFIKGGLPNKSGLITSTSLNRYNLPLSLVYLHPYHNTVNIQFNRDCSVLQGNIPTTSGNLLIVRKMPLGLTILELLFADAMLNNSDRMAPEGSPVFNQFWDANKTTTFFSPVSYKYPPNFTYEMYQDYLKAHCITENLSRADLYDGRVIQTMNPLVTLKVVNKDGVIKLTADNTHFSILLPDEAVAVNGIAYNIDTAIAW